MNINEMSDQEKSVMLARLCGWIKPASELIKANLWKFNSGGYYHLDGAYTKNPDWFYELNLYQLDDFVLAWRVLNWAMNQNFALNESYTFKDELHDYLTDVSAGELEGVFEFLPADAQRAWLDKILSLAVEAGMVEVEK